VFVLLLGIFATAAVLLAAIGIYGVMAHAVSQRTREIGLRMALGASRYEVFRLVLKQGMLTGLAGVAAGLALAFGVTRLMSRLLYGVSPTDPITFALIALLFTVVTLLACYLPARRAICSSKADFSPKKTAPIRRWSPSSMRAQLAATGPTKTLSASDSKGRMRVDGTMTGLLSSAWCATCAAMVWKDSRHRTFSNGINNPAA
jgi:predicted lysophospholipase L1 biosynthesis ABC-type transport system permease subunit